ncbi:uroporphyrinogen-III synthase [Neisseria montereyensis]|uniref:Uroporphyrinogen-III synthase n=1 Tax=Neisseria montereyensis TaxID=2973938 RepID=A0ABT2FBS7_9NEIS|nr:uroporphyrinogen-III synthase [Neisseria montereyensis]MCS4533621.1 uroporphyrinogen-III synthase [Neisseria montereyensis]
MPVILIMRPQARIAADAAECEAAGWQAVPFSLTRIEPEEQALHQLNERFQKADAVFWVSPSAIEIAAPYIEFVSDGPVQLTVGEASKQALAAFYRGEVICPAAGNDSEALLALDIWQKLPPAAKVLIICGHGGRDFLKKGLLKRGFEVETAEVYFRRPISPDWALFKAVKPQAAYITSTEAVRILFDCVPEGIAESLRTLLYFTHHPRIAEVLRNAGVHNIKMVQRLDKEVLMHCM